jgi:hypothetical protein
MKEKEGHIPLSNIITAAAHRECDLLCAWYKNSYVFRNKFVSKVKSIHTQYYDTASSYSTHLLFKKSSLKTQNHSKFHKNLEWWYRCSICPQMTVTLLNHVLIMSTDKLDVISRVQYFRSWTWLCITTCSVCPQLNLTLHYVFSMSAAELDIALQRVQYVHNWTWHCITCSVCPQPNFTVNYNMFSMSTAELDVMSRVQNVHPEPYFDLI